MKKILLTSVLMFIAMFAHAQFYVGGGVSFTESKGLTGQKAQEFSFLPELGYKIDDKLSIGATLSFVTQKDIYTAYMLEPYVRYSFFKSGNLSLFADSFVAFGNVDIDNEESHVVWGAGVAPGICFDFTKHFSAVAHVGLLSYLDCKDVVRNKNISLNCNDISLSLYYNF